MNNDWTVKKLTVNKKDPFDLFLRIENDINSYRRKQLLNHGGSHEIIHIGCKAPVLNYQTRQVYRSGKNEWRCSVCEEIVPKQIAENLFKVKDLANHMEKLDDE